MSQRAHDAIQKTGAGLLKLVYPHRTPDDVEPDELQFCLNLAVEMRQRVIEQLQAIAPKEFQKVRLRLRVDRAVRARGAVATCSAARVMAELSPAPGRAHQPTAVSAWPDGKGRRAFRTVVIGRATVGWSAAERAYALSLWERMRVRVWPQPTLSRVDAGGQPEWWRQKAV